MEQVIIYQTQIPQLRPQEGEAGSTQRKLNVCGHTKRCPDVISLHPSPKRAVVGSTTPFLQAGNRGLEVSDLFKVIQLVHG